MKMYHSPEILFEGIFPSDVLTVSFLSFLDEKLAVVKDELEWGQVNETTTQ